MKQIGLFAGIGGFELAARWVGWETIAVSEIDAFCQKVLQYHFPGAQLHGDIKTTDFTGYRGQCDVITGGFPCQPFSTAGKRRGTADERYLWPEMLRVIDEVKPRWVIGENVRGLVNWDGGVVFDTVCSELENIGYEVQPFIIPACGVNAPHRRDRIWFVANARSNGLSRGSDEIRHGQNTNDKERNVSICTEQRQNEFWRSNKGRSEVGHDYAGNVFNGANTSDDATNSDSIGFQGSIQRKCNDKQGRNKQVINASQHLYTHESRMETRRWENFPTQPPICGGDDGLPKELDGITLPKWLKESIKGYGNAIVPQVAYEIYKAIMLYEQIGVENE